MFLALALLTVFAILAPQISYAQPAFQIEFEDTDYQVPYTIASGSVLEGNIDLESSSLTVKTTPAEGKLVLSFPRVLLDHLANIGELTVFVDGVGVDFREEATTCETRSISIVLPAGSEEIQIVGVSPGLGGQPGAILNIVEMNQSFPISISSESIICGWQFSKEEKTLNISVQNGTSMTVIMPKKLLAGPYSLLINGTPANFTSAASGNDYERISVEYSGAKEIQLTGSSAIPEFSVLATLIIASAIGLALAAAKTFKGFRNSGY